MTINKENNNNTKINSNLNNLTNELAVQATLAKAIVYDGKRMRKTVTRRTVDYNASIINWLEVIYLFYY